MKCPKCGSVLPDNSVFCSYCGCNIDEILTAIEKQRNCCPNCGITAPEGSNFCPHCGFRFSGSATVEKPCQQQTLPTSYKTITSPSTYTYYSTPSQKQTTHKRRIFPIVAVLMLAVAIIITFKENFTKPTSQESAPTIQESSSTNTKKTPTPVPIKNGQILNYPSGGDRVAPLSVETTGSLGYYIVLKPLQYYEPKVTSKNLKTGEISLGSPMSFYVEGGMTADVEVPLGEYEIYYATGENWYGVNVLFGEDTQRYKCEGTFDFYLDGDYYQGWTLELYPQTNGNMDTEIVSTAEFPS